MRLRERVKKLEAEVSTLKDMLSGIKPGRPPLKLDQAKRYLVKRLKDGPIMVNDLVEEGLFGYQLLSKARNSLGYASYRQGGNWFWSQ